MPTSKTCGDRGSTTSLRHVYLNGLVMFHAEITRKAYSTHFPMMKKYQPNVLDKWNDHEEGVRRETNMLTGVVVFLV